MTLALRQIRHTPLRPDGSGVGTVASGYYLWEPSKPYDDGTGRVERIPLQVNVDGAAATVDIAVTPVDFSWAWKVTGHLRGQKDDTVEYVRVPTGTYATVLDFEDLVRVDPSTLGPTTSDQTALAALTARVVALEAGGGGGGGGAVASVAGKTGVVTLVAADLTNATASGLSVVTGSAATGLSALGGAPTASPTFTGTVTLPSTIVIPDGSIAQADVNGLVAGLAGKVDATAVANTPIYWATVSGAYPARPATLRPVVFTDPNVMPANTGSTSGGGGMVPGLDYWIS